MKPYSLSRRLTSFGISIEIILGIVSIAFLVFSPPVLAKQNPLDDPNACDRLYQAYEAVEQICIDECDLEQKQRYFDAQIALQKRMDVLGCEVANLLSLCGGLTDITQVYYDVEPAESNISVGDIVKLSATFNGSPCITKSKGEEVEGEVSGSQSWGSDDTSIATVDPTSGLVRGENPGIVRIHVMSDVIIPIVGPLEGVAIVKVDCDMEGAYIDVSTTELEVEEGKTEQIVATPVGPDCFKNLIWESNDVSVATVDQNGNVTGVDGGMTQVVVRNEILSLDWPEIKTVITVTVKPKENAVEIDPTIAEIHIGDPPLYLHARVVDSEGEVIPDAVLHWWIEPEGQDIIEFDETTQLVTALKEGGPVEIWAEYETVSSSATITVLKDKPDYLVTAWISGYGEIWMGPPSGGDQQQHGTFQVQASGTAELHYDETYGMYIQTGGETTATSGHTSWDIYHASICCYMHRDTNMSGALMLIGIGAWGLTDPEGPFLLAGVSPVEAWTQCSQTTQYVGEDDICHPESWYPGPTCEVVMPACGEGTPDFYYGQATSTEGKIYPDESGLIFSRTGIHHYQVTGFSTREAYWSVNIELTPITP